MLPLLHPNAPWQQRRHLNRTCPCRLPSTQVVVTNGGIAENNWRLTNFTMDFHNAAGTGDVANSGSYAFSGASPQYVIGSECARFLAIRSCLPCPCCWHRASPNGANHLLAPQPAYPRPLLRPLPPLSCPPQCAPW
jgi:hypothetical protein